MIKMKGEPEIQSEKISQSGLTCLTYQAMNFESHGLQHVH